MNRHAFSFSAIALLLAMAGGASAEPDASIVARGHHVKLGWLMTDGPDINGRYSVAIDISDLDPATAPGWARMERRVDFGVSELCDLAGARPLVAGYFDPVQRDCLKAGHEMAQAQMERARTIAGQGQSVATLGIDYKAG